MTTPTPEPKPGRAREWLRRLPGAIGVGAVLLLAIGYIWLALGLGQGLTPSLRTALKVSAGLVVLGFVATIVGRRIAARVAQALAVVIAIGVSQAEDRRIAEQNVQSGKERVAKNELLLASAIARVPCRNGDIATFQMISGPKNDFNSLSIHIVPADRSGFSDLLVSAHGKFKPPMDDDIRAYKRRTGTDCSGPDYPSLDAMFQRIVQHHEREKIKYEQPGGNPKP